MAELALDPDARDKRLMAAQMTPDQIKKTFAKALAARNSGDAAAARKLFERILRARPKTPEALFHLGSMAGEAGDFVAGGKHFEAALKLKPAEAAIWLAYLDMAVRHPDPGKLRVLLGRAGQVLAQHPAAAFYRGMSLRQSDPQAAIAALEAARDQGLTRLDLFTTLADLLSDQGDSDRALELLDIGLTHHPDAVALLAARIELLRSLGQIEAARDAARAAIAAHSDTGLFYYSYTSLAKVPTEDPLLVQMTEKARAGLGDRDRIFLHAALAKAAEDRSDGAEMFAHLGKSKSLISKQFSYDIARDRSEFAAIREAWDPFVSQLPLDGASTARPIFVSGLPRSGTSLVEQILASHPEVAGGGELGWLGPDITGPILLGYQEDRLGRAMVTAGQRYGARLAARFGAGRVTDKSISTLAIIGPVLAALPRARIVLVQRDPRDNALSIYKNLFTLGRHRYSHNLVDIARYMRLCETQIAFWQERVPDQIHVITYEALVGDLEAQARALLRFSELDWDPACLEFHRTKRRVDTLSATQVRQPIYSSSVGRWRQHATALAPFVDEYRRLGGGAERS